MPEECPPIARLLAAASTRTGDDPHDRDSRRAHHGPGPWHFGFFNLTNGLPEQMATGREALWVDKFTDTLEIQKEGVGPAEVKEFAKYLKDPAHLRASFEYFRALPQDVAANAVNIKTPLTMPVLAIGARGGIAEGEAVQVRQYATNVIGTVVEDSGHWMYEERPAYMTELLLDFLDDGSLS
jgi:pimeloyl-ACP methyl ester carboxylesterase